MAFVSGRGDNAFGISGIVLSSGDETIAVPLVAALAITDETPLAIDIGGNSFYPRAIAKRKSTASFRITIDGAAPELIAAAHGAAITTGAARLTKVSGDAPVIFATSAEGELLEISVDIAAGGAWRVNIITASGIAAHSGEWNDLVLGAELSSNLTITRTEHDAPTTAQAAKWRLLPPNKTMAAPRAPAVREWRITALARRGGEYDRQFTIHIPRAVFDGGTERLRDMDTTDGQKEISGKIIADDASPPYEIVYADADARAPAQAAAAMDIARLELVRHSGGGISGGNGWRILLPQRVVSIGAGAQLIGAPSLPALAAELQKEVGGRFYIASVGFSTGDQRRLAWQLRGFDNVVVSGGSISLGYPAADQIDTNAIGGFVGDYNGATAGTTDMRLEFYARADGIALPISDFYPPAFTGVPSLIMSLQGAGNENTGSGWRYDGNGNFVISAILTARGALYPDDAGALAELSIDRAPSPHRPLIANVGGNILHFRQAVAALNQPAYSEQARWNIGDCLLQTNGNYQNAHIEGDGRICFGANPAAGAFPSHADLTDPTITWRVRLTGSSSPYNGNSVVGASVAAEQNAPFIHRNYRIGSTADMQAAFGSVVLDSGGGQLILERQTSSGSIGISVVPANRISGNWAAAAVGEAGSSGLVFSRNRSAQR